MSSPQSVKPAASQLSPEVAEKLAGLKADAAAQFLKKDFTKAVEGYEQAAMLLPDDATTEKSDLVLKKAGCLMGLKRYKDAVRECTTILQSQPECAAALKTRSKAYEQMNFFKQALTDIQALNKTESANAESRLMEQRLKSTMASNKSKLAGSGSSNAGGEAAAVAPTPRAAKAAAPASAQNSNPYLITIKCIHGSEAKSLQASLMVTYAELYKSVEEKFPSAAPFMLKYTDKDGDAITISSRNDIQSHLQELVAVFQKQNAHAPRLVAPQLPPMKIEVVSCAKAEVPAPPADEVAALKGAEAETKGEDADSAEADEPWLLRFAKLFSEVASIDPASHHEHINMGHEVMAKALDAVVTEESAGTMFSKAGDHFRDATSAALIQWGNVHVVKAERHAQALLRSGKEIGKTDLDLMMTEFKETEKKINQALGFKPDSWEATGSLGQLEWERLKAKLGYVVPSQQSVEGPSSEGKTPEQIATESQAAVSAAVKKALAKLNAKSVKNVESHLKQADEWFGKALGFAKTADAAKKVEEAEAEAKAAAEAAAKKVEGTEAEAEEKQPELTAEEKQQAQLASPTGNMLIMHGNVLYEWSQVLAAVGNPWRPTLDSAVEKFRAAGATEAEIRSALKNHTHVEELDLGPEPEPEATPPAAAAAAAEEPKAPAAAAAAPAAAAAAPAAAAAEEPKAAAKGLPSLQVKKKKGEK